MAKQSRLEEEAIILRKETLVKNDYQTGDTEYNEKHSNALSHDDENHPLGKGTGSGGHTYSIPNSNKSKTMYEYQIDTQNGGGSYDKFGRNGVGGRQRSQIINLYSPDKAYGPDSIDTSANINDGQFSL